MSVSKYKERAYEGIMNLLWWQWGALGIAGHTADSAETMVIDPESLILFSSRFCRYDQRLYDLMASWMQKYSSMLNPIRLKALHAKAEYKDTASLGFLAALCLKHGDNRWKPAAKEYRPAAESLQPMFICHGDDSALYCRRQDELALRYGLQRNPFVAQNKLRQQLPESASTVLLRLRGLLGVSARAEVILLLSISPHSIQQLADFSSFGRSTVKAALDDLVQSHFVSSVKTKAGTLYTLNDTRLASMICGTSANFSFPHWFAIYEALGKWWNVITAPNMAKVSHDTFVGELKLTFRNHLRPALFRCGIPQLENLSESALLELPDLLHDIFV